MEMIAGRYRLLQPLAGSLRLAQDEQLHQQVFLREVTLPPELDDDAREVLAEGIMQAAEAARRPAHPSINLGLGSIFDGGRLFIVTAPIAGRPLSQVVAELGALPLEQVVGIGRELLDALGKAHALGVMHGAIRPENVWITPDGHAVLSGFGTAVAARSADAASVGSPGFGAPESLESPAPAADLWSVAATLYFAVEGVAPFAGNGPLEVLAAVLADEPRPPERAGELGPILLAQLAKDPAQRPVTFRESLDEITVMAAPVGRVAVRPRTLALVAAGLAVAVASVAITTTEVLTGKPTAEPPLAASPAGDPAGADPGRFAAVPRACGLLTDQQAGQLVPNFTKLSNAFGKQDPNAQCHLSTAESSADSVTLNIKLLALAPGALGGGPDNAREFIIGTRDDQQRNKGLSGDTSSPIRDVTGVGDQAIAWDSFSNIGTRYDSTVVLRSSNLIATVACEITKPAGAVQQKISGLGPCATQAAQWIAQVLGRQG